MSFSGTTARNDALGDGNTSEFDYGFRIVDEGHLLVLIADDAGIQFDPLEIDTDYTVSGVNDGSGGSITLVDNGQGWLNGSGNLVADYPICILSAVPNSQESDIRNQGSFFPETHEEIFDRLTRQIQQLQDQVDHAIRFQSTIKAVDLNGDSGDPTPLGYLRANADADGFEYSALIGDSVEIRSGIEDLGSAVNTMTVVFGVPMGSPDYAVSLTLKNTGDVNPIMIQSQWWIVSQDEDGFEIGWADVTDSTNYSVAWTATGLTE